MVSYSQCRDGCGLAGEQFRRHVQLGAVDHGQRSHQIPWYAVSLLGLHATSCLYACLSVLVDKMELKVERVVCGSLMTSLEMAGVSLTLLKLQPGWDQCIGMCCVCGCLQSPY